METTRQNITTRILLKILMPSKYWIKLYHEMLDDPKMGMMSDRHYRRTIELFLMAGDFDQDGLLPSVTDMAWRLRLSHDELEQDLQELSKVEIVSQNEDGSWYVTKFAERQSADSNTERWRKWRERQLKQDYYGSDTDNQRDTNDTFEDIPEPEIIEDAIPTQDQRPANETFADIDKEKDKESESEEKQKQIRVARAREQPPPNGKTATAADFLPSSQIIGIISQATGMVAIPPNELERVEQIHSMIDHYGVKAVRDALAAAFKLWIDQSRKDGRGKYKRTNFGWVDWAQEKLAGGVMVAEPESKEESLRREWLEKTSNE